MPLFLRERDEQPFTGNYKELIENELVKEVAAEFASRPRQQPVQAVLYVGQREMATVIPKRGQGVVRVIGTDDATTCHVAVIRHRTSGVTTLSHLDGSQVAQCISKLLKSCSDESRRASAGAVDSSFDVFLVGGFNDDQLTSVGLSNETISALQSQPHHITLKLACITALNDRMEGRHHKPIIYGMGIDVQTGEVFPASFPVKGPDMDLRSARLFTGSEETLPIYDPSSGELRIGPFDYSKFPGGEALLHMPDHMILQNLSTSPFAEPPHFVESTKAAVRYICNHPRPRETVFSNRPRCYIQDPQTGEWVPRQA